MERDERISSSSHSSGSNSYDDDDDVMEEENELVPYRPELEYVNSQIITLLIPPITGPPHPRTVYFINDPKLNENKPQDHLKTVNVKITEKKLQKGKNQMNVSNLPKGIYIIKTDNKTLKLIKK